MKADSAMKRDMEALLCPVGGWQPSDNCNDSEPRSGDSRRGALGYRHALELTGMLPSLLRSGVHRALFGLFIFASGVLPTAGCAQTYTTTFKGEENPLSENGKWRNNGLDWAQISKSGGIAHGTQTGTDEGSQKYNDSYAHLSGFPPDQEAWGEVYIAKPDASCYQEVEILLRWTSSPHSTTGYECFARCVKNGSSYVQIVRWEGPLGKFTYLADKRGPEFGLQNGDILKASVVGNVITLYINGIEKARVTDDTHKTGNPGIGEFLECVKGHGIGTNKDFGFKSFTARGISPSS
jgi:hypothetical protein